jgi:hypothetical protein
MEFSLSRFWRRSRELPFVTRPADKWRAPILGAALGTFDDKAF